jgi:hypothetical protein
MRDVIPGRTSARTRNLDIVDEWIFGLDAAHRTEITHISDYPNFQLHYF